MRALLIAVVALFTLLTFYSALWYKSETIEQDITDRVTRDLEEAGAPNVDVSVDGRHVTLSGVVYDTETESRYLATADATHGALGPIDGLTIPSNGGFVKAMKTDAGITLTGAVPSEEARTALVAAAAGATEGTVEDKLTIGAASGAWQEETGFGLAQMAGLSAGTLTTTPDSFALSGVTSGAVAPVAEAFDGRDGWQTYLSSPAETDALSARVSALQGDLGTRDQTITDLTGERDALIGERDALADERNTLSGSLAAMTVARDAAQAQRDAREEEFDSLRASLDANQTDVANLTVERDQALSDLEAANGTIDERNERIASLITERDEVAGKVEDLNSKIADLTSSNGSLTEELAAQRAAQSGDLTALQDDLASQTSRADKAEADLAKARQTIADRDGTLANLETQLGETEAEVARLQAETETLTTAANAAADDQLTAARAQVEAAEAKAGTLEQDVAALQSDLQARDGTIADLQTQLGETEADVARLQAEAEALSSAAAEADPQIATLTAAVAAQSTRADTLEGEVAALNGTIAERDATIAALRDAPATGLGAEQISAQCSARANTILENAQINFETATADIEGDSVATLERLTGIALACTGSGLAVEVGGHTDDRGSDENNQALSERRAQAIVAFMAERGVPTDTLKAVGFGETRPIADNATAEGRAQNRRISFDWQAR